MRLDTDTGVRHGERNRWRRPVLRQRHSKADLAVLRELHGVAQQIDQHLAQPQRVSHQGRRYVWIHVGGEAEPFLTSPWAEQRLGFGDDLVQVERHVVQIEVPGLDFREVEDVVDQLEQVVTRVTEHFDVLALLGGERRFPQQVGHAEDPVHRRADLVAHRRQEFALRPVGVLGTPRLLERLTRAELDLLKPRSRRLP